MGGIHWLPGGRFSGGGWSDTFARKIFSIAPGIRPGRQAPATGRGGGTPVRGVATHCHSSVSSTHAPSVSSNSSKCTYILQQKRHKRAGE